MSVKLVLRKVPNEPSKSYLFIRTIVNRKTKFKSLGIKINSNNLKKSEDGVKSVEPNYKEINETIERELNSVKVDGNLKVLYQKEAKKKSVIKFIDKIIENTPNQGTIRSRLTAKNALLKYLGSCEKDDITFSQITPDFIDAYFNWMLKNEYKKNTANQYLRLLQTFLNIAKENEKLKLPESYNPFSRFKFKRSPVKNKALNKEELRLFANANFGKKSYSLYRDMFMFQLYGGGLRVSDVLLLRWENIYLNNLGEIVLDYKAFKTDKRIEANLFTNALNYLLLPIERYYPDYQEKIEECELKIEQYQEKLKKEKSNLEKEEKIMPKPYEVYKALDAGKVIDLHEAMMQELLVEGIRTKIQDFSEHIEFYSERLLRYFQESIEKLNTNYPEQYIFPFLWDKAENESRINNKADLLNKKDTAIVNNERSKYTGQLKRMQKRLDIKTVISPHTARHTFTQLLMESNVNAHYISIALGHNSMDTTEQYRRTLQNRDSMSLNTHLPSL